MKKFLYICYLLSVSLYSIPSIPPKTNLLTFLQQLQQNTSSVRLHLGCGQSHLSNYVNIDFPPTQHTVQTTSGADLFGDITQLIFPQESIDEVRSHHVFEHFNRQHALALIAIWHTALKIGGTLFIETPDFEESIKLLVQPSYTYANKQKILRHIFGSHEAFWAYHYDGWYEEKFRHILNSFGFTVQEVTKSAYLVTRNITVIAKKTKHYTVHELQNIGHTLLQEHMIAASPDEISMWQVWCREFDSHFMAYIHL